MGSIKYAEDFEKRNWIVPFVLPPLIWCDQTAKKTWVLKQPGIESIIIGDHAPQKLFLL